MFNPPNQEEQRILDDEVENLRRTYDGLTTKSNRLRSQLGSISDSIVAAEREGFKPQLSNSDLSRRIRSLENQLDSSLIKFNEAQNIKKTYENIIEKMRNERLGFESQLLVTERALASKQRDLDEVMLLSVESVYAKEVAMNELNRFRLVCEEENLQQQTELRERAQLLQLRKQMYDRNMKRDKLRRELEDADKLEKSLALFNILKDKRAQTSAKFELRNKIHLYEEAFRSIREATGVSNANEVIEKIRNQVKVANNLAQISHENELKIEALNQEFHDLKCQNENFKFENNSAASLTNVRNYREQIDGNELELAQSKLRFEAEQTKFEQMNIALATIRTGVENLQEQLAPFYKEFDDICAASKNSLICHNIDCKNEIDGLFSRLQMQDQLLSQLTSVLSSHNYQNCEHLAGVRSKSVYDDNLKVAIPADLRTTHIAQKSCDLGFIGQTCNKDSDCASDGWVVVEPSETTVAEVISDTDNKGSVNASSSPFPPNALEPPVPRSAGTSQARQQQLTADDFLQQARGSIRITDRSNCDNDDDNNEEIRRATAKKLSADIIKTVQKLGRQKQRISTASIAPKSVKSAAAIVSSQRLLLTVRNTKN